MGVCALDNSYAEDDYKTSASAFKEKLSYIGLSLQSKLSQIVFIDGTFKGNIDTAKQVVIKNNGNFLGNVKAKVLHVSGIVFGDIDVDFLIIYNTGKVYSNNIKSNKVFVYNHGMCLNRNGNPDFGSSFCNLIENLIGETKGVKSAKTKTEEIVPDKPNHKVIVPGFSEMAFAEIQPYKKPPVKIKERTDVNKSLEMTNFVNSF